MTQEDKDRIAAVLRKHTLPEMPGLTASAEGWSAIINQRPEPLLFWAITSDKAVHGVIKGAQGLT